MDKEASAIIIITPIAMSSTAATTTTATSTSTDAKHHGHGHPHHRHLTSRRDVVASHVIRAPIDQVWAQISGFFDLKWCLGSGGTCAPKNVKHSVTDNPLGSVRCVRHSDSLSLEEELVAYSKIDYSYTAKIVSYENAAFSGVHLHNYHATIKLERVTTDDTTFAKISAHFHADPANADPIADHIQKHILENSLKGLGTTLAAATASTSSATTATTAAAST